jgi:hypothetical protein
MHPLHQIRKLLPFLQDSLISLLFQQSSDHDDIDVLEGKNLFRGPECVRCLLDQPFHVLSKLWLHILAD